MQYLRLGHVLQIHRAVVAATGGDHRGRDLAALESALAQPRMSFGGEDLYVTVAQKAAALAHSLVTNHPFVDGNKRVGHAAMELFLVINGYELSASEVEQEANVLQLAAGQLTRAEWTIWVESHVMAR
jgi:death on curing protein